MRKMNCPKCKTMIDLRLWLIQKIVGKIPVCLNMKISPPKEKIPEAIVFGGKETHGIVSRCFICSKPNEFIMRPIDFDTGKEI